MKCDLNTSELCRLYDTGLSTDAIGKLFGVSKIPVLRILRAAGVKMRRANVLSDAEKCRSESLSLYAAGLTIDQISASLGINSKTVTKFLKSGDVEIRDTSAYVGLNGWMVSADLDQKEIKALYDSGWTIPRIAKQFNVGFGTARRHLVKAGTEFRPVSSVPVYIHKSPCAGVIRVRGSWEMYYAQILDVWYLENRISGWSYESQRIPVDSVGAGRYYLPDFRVSNNDGGIVFHEIKGVLRDLSARKIESARNSGFHIILIRQKLLYALCRHYRLPITASKS